MEGTRGLASARNLDVDESGDNMVAVPCVMKWYYVSNTNAANLYLKFYNTAGTPTVGTDTPVLTCMIPTGAAANVGLPVEGVHFSLGIGIGATTGAADADTGAPGANDVIVNVGYNEI